MSQASPNPTPPTSPDDSTRATVELMPIGSSTGVILPQAMLDRLRVQEGDLLQVIEVADGFKIQAVDPEFAAQMAVAERVMHRRYDVLRKLAE